MYLIGNTYVPNRYGSLQREQHVLVVTVLFENIERLSPFHKTNEHTFMSQINYRVLSDH